MSEDNEIKVVLDGDPVQIPEIKMLPAEDIAKPETEPVFLACDTESRCLFIAIPSKDRKIALGACMGLLGVYRLLTTLGIKMMVHGVAEAGIILARNLALAEFRADKEATHFLFLDDDTIFLPDTILDLLESGLDAVGGAYPTRGTDWGGLFARFQDGQIKTPEDAALLSSPIHVRFDESTLPLRFEADRFVEVAGLGGGFLMLSRACVEKLAERAQPIVDTRPPGVRFEGDLRLIVKNDLGAPTKTSAGKYTFWGEDYSLCNEIRAAGFKLYADINARFEHVGPANFASYSLGEMLAIGAARAKRAK